MAGTQSLRKLWLALDVVLETGGDHELCLGLMYVDYDEEVACLFVSESLPGQGSRRWPSEFTDTVIVVLFISLHKHCIVAIN